MLNAGSPPSEIKAWMSFDASIISLGDTLTCIDSPFCPESVRIPSSSALPVILPVVEAGDPPSRMGPPSNTVDSGYKMSATVFVEIGTINRTLFSTVASTRS